MKKRRHPIPDVAGSFPATLALDRQLHEILAVPDRLDQRQREERKPGLLPGIALVALTPTGTAAKGHVGQAAQAENREQPLQDPVADQNHLAVVAKTASRKPLFRGDGACPASIGSGNQVLGVPRRPLKAENTRITRTPFLHGATFSDGATDSPTALTGHARALINHLPGNHAASRGTAGRQDDADDLGAIGKYDLPNSLAQGPGLDQGCDVQPAVRPHAVMSRTAATKGQWQLRWNQDGGDEADHWLCGWLDPPETAGGNACHPRIHVMPPVASRRLVPPRQAGVRRDVPGSRTRPSRRGRGLDFRQANPNHLLGSRRGIRLIKMASMIYNAS